VIRPAPRTGSPLQRRQLLRAGFAAVGTAAALGVAGALVPFLRVTRVIGLGETIIAGKTADILARFDATDDTPILYPQHRFFLLRAPGGIVAAYRKCTHLGCAVPYAPGEDRFHCPCHQSVFDKHTAVVISGPAPKPLQLFHVREEANGDLLVDTNPLTVIDRRDNRWDDAHLEVRA
jgi:cytochrome b6-f complex iron-sulfur subunit